jgi:large subunit ribosomal protein L24
MATERLRTKLKKGDTVMALSGKDRGKTGKVLRILPFRAMAIVEGINLVKKSMRKTQQDQQGGIVERENPMRLSNLALYCKNCNKPTRVGVSKLSDGTKSRFCKKCKEMV